MYVDYPVGCYVYISLTVQSLPKSTILILVFIGPCILNRGQACWLFKDNSKLLFLLIKWLWKRVKIKHLLNIDHTSHFVTTFFLNFFFLHCLLVFCTAHYFVCLWGFFICTSQSWQKFYTIFSYRVVFQCELMTVFVIVAGRALLVVMCWKLACMLWFLSGVENPANAPVYNPATLVVALS